MAEVKIYKTEPLKCWNEAKYLRQKYYEDYYSAPKRGGLRVSGSAIWWPAIARGLGKDVCTLTGEPYAATVASHLDFSTTCMEAVERAGIARDLCAYLRNYWGSILIDKYILPDGTIIDGFPVADLLYTGHMCCSHAKWYQYAAQLEGDRPFRALDICMHPYAPETPITPRRLNYMVAQLYDLIEWMGKKTGREFNDELFIEAMHNEMRSAQLWGEICTFQKANPAPLDEKTMFSFYVFMSLNPYDKEVINLYEKLRDEVKDRVERGIASSPMERLRVMMGTSQPPWAFLQIWRYLQKEYGVVSIGSVYTFGLQTQWDIDEEGNIIPAKTLKDKGIEVRTREEALRHYAEFKLKNWVVVGIVSQSAQAKMCLRIMKQWKVDAMFMHLNRGSEGSCLGQTETRLDLLKENIPVVTFEGNMADHREFDLPRTLARLDAFFEGLGVERLSKKIRKEGYG